MSKLPRTLFSGVKHLAFGRGRGPQRVRFSLFRGMHFNLDPTDSTQHILGLYEREIHPYLRRYAAGARSAIEVGASDGHISIWLGSQPDVERVCSFEPREVLRHEFEANVALNPGISRAKFDLRAEYVGNRDEAGWFRLDALSKTIHGPCVLKIDVDGGEVEVLEGSLEFLRRIETRLVIETHSQELEDNCIRVLRAAGYETKVIRQAWWRRFASANRTIEFNQWLVAVRPAPWTPGTLLDGIGIAGSEATPNEKVISTGAA